MTDEPDFREPVHPDPRVQAERDVAVFVKANRRLLETLKTTGEQLMLFSEAA